MLVDGDDAGLLHPLGESGGVVEHGGGVVAVLPLPCPDRSVGRGIGDVDQIGHGRQVHRHPDVGQLLTPRQGAGAEVLGGHGRLLERGGDGGQAAALEDLDLAALLVGGHEQRGAVGGVGADQSGHGVHDAADRLGPGVGLAGDEDIADVVGGYGVDGGQSGARGLDADHDELTGPLLRAPALQRVRVRRGGGGGRGGGDVVRVRSGPIGRSLFRGGPRLPPGAPGQGGGREQTGEDHGAPARPPARGEARRVRAGEVVHGGQPIHDVGGAGSWPRWRPEGRWVVHCQPSS